MQPLLLFLEIEKKPKKTAWLVSWTHFRWVSCLTRKCSLKNLLWAGSTLAISDNFRLCRVNPVFFTMYQSHGVTGCAISQFPLLIFSMPGVACPHANFHQKIWVQSSQPDIIFCTGSTRIFRGKMDIKGGDGPYGLWLPASGARRLRGLYSSAPRTDYDGQELWWVIPPRIEPHP